MKEVKFYEAFDGMRFDTANDCVQYETLKLKEKPSFFDDEGFNVNTVTEASYAFFTKREVALLYRDAHIRDAFGSDSCILADVINKYEYEEIQFYYFDYSDCEWHHYGELKSQVDSILERWNIVKDIMNSKGE